MSNFQATQWFRGIAACGPVLPSLIGFFFPSLTIPLFTPRQIINDNNLWSFLLGIWASPTSFSSHLSRALQAAFVFLLPTSTLQYYVLWLLTAALRTGVGQLLTRVVGWAAPQFFSHWALYEACGGYGPSIVIYVFLCGIPPNVTKFLYQRTSPATNSVLLVCFCALLCWLDDAPWTYGLAIVGAGTIALVSWIFRMISSSSHIPPPMSLLPDGQAAPPKLKAIFGSTVLALLALTLPYGILYQFSTLVPTDMPVSPTPGSPLLEILILSFPRPNIEVSTQIMATTINSFIPHLDPNVTLSVFTHSTSHPSFDTVRKLFASTNVTFYTDSDAHLDYWSGQYLHIAEAFRWVIERPNQAEWVMLVEDDFPICGGDRGWDAVKRVMQILEAPSGAVRNRQGAFIGTGGRYGTSQ
ncbi:hypothetical protein H0H92_013731 [Tricholoma furcatifolium]|nr:hypothetical protein H0H92_013731 [Tricholoma furcatifolium]